MISNHVSPTLSKNWIHLHLSSFYATKYFSKKLAMGKCFLNKLLNLSLRYLVTVIVYVFQKLIILCQNKNLQDKSFSELLLLFFSTAKSIAGGNIGNKLVFLLRGQVTYKISSQNARFWTSFGIDLLVERGLKNLCIFIIGYQMLKFSSFKWLYKCSNCHLNSYSIFRKLHKIAQRLGAEPPNPVCDTFEVH